MVSLRLARVGRKGQPSFRLIVVDKQKDPFGRSIEILGKYAPQAKPKLLEFKKDRVEYWLSKGAQPTPTVHNILVAQGVITEKKVRTSHLTKKRTAKIEAAKPKPVEAKETKTEDQKTEDTAEAKTE